MEIFNIYIAHFLYGYNQMRFTTPKKPPEEIPVESNCY